jgi:uncharacterized protein YqhQ
MPRGEYLQYGGQAVVEGVMMRSPRFFSIACRAPDGQIVVQTEAIEKTWVGKQRWLKRPFLRGTLALLDAMALGSRAMRFATGVQLDPAYGGPAVEGQVASAGAAAPSKRVQDIAVGGTMVFAIILGLFIFAYVPNLIAEYSQRRLGVTSSTRINLVSEVIKIVIFLGYIAAIGTNREIRRVFEYHGAEHKAINSLEAEQDLNLANCREQTRLHPRCGTSFAIIVLLLGLMVFTFVPRYPITGHQGHALADVTVRVALEILILPFIAGIAYELLRLAGKFRNQTYVNMLFKPGIWTQYLTTREPDETQIEVSLTALKAVLAAEEVGAVVASPVAVDKAAAPVPG